MPSGPVLNMAEAARACGLSVSTMRRHRDALLAHGATRHDASWVIPVSALVAAGLMPNVTPPDASPGDGVTPVMTRHPDGSLTPPDTPTHQEVERLREALADAKRRADVAEAIAAERERIITVQAQALRLLEAGPSPRPPAPTPSSSGAPDGAPDTASTGRRRWWQRA